MTLTLDRPGLALRPYQDEALAAVEQAASRGLRRPLVSLPTGAGKTILFAHLLSRRARLGRGIILVHRDELVQQATEKLRLIEPSLTPGVVKAERDDHAAPTVVASIQTLSQERRLARFVLGTREQPLATIVCDEAHHAVAESWQRVLTGLGAFRPGGPLVLGVTATPERADGRGLDEVWERIVYERQILDLIPDYLVDVRGVRVSLALDLDTVTRTAGDFQEASLGEAMEQANAPAEALQAYRTHAAGRKTLLFTPTVRLARVMATTFAQAGIAAAWISGETSIEERRAP